MRDYFDFIVCPSKDSLGDEREIDLALDFELRFADKDKLKKEVFSRAHRSTF